MKKHPTADSTTNSSRSKSNQVCDYIDMPKFKCLGELAIVKKMIFSAWFYCSLTFSDGILVSAHDDDDGDVVVAVHGQV